MRTPKRTHWTTRTLPVMATEHAKLDALAVGPKGSGARGINPRNGRLFLTDSGNGWSLKVGDQPVELGEEDLGQIDRSLGIPIRFGERLREAYRKTYVDLVNKMLWGEGSDPAFTINIKGGGSEPYGVALRDAIAILENEGWVDLIRCDVGDSGVRVLLGSLKEDLVEQPYGERWPLRPGWILTEHKGDRHGAWISLCLFHQASGRTFLLPTRSAMYYRVDPDGLKNPQQLASAIVEVQNSLTWKKGSSRLGRLAKRWLKPERVEPHLRSLRIPSAREGAVEAVVGGVRGRPTSEAWILWHLAGWSRGLEPTARHRVEKEVGEIAWHRGVET